MKQTLLLMFAATTAGIIVSGQPVFARGGGPANIINSPGYQRRLEESRQQSSQSDVQAAPTNHRKPHHHHQH
jgi:hypothetical protein